MKTLVQILILVLLISCGEKQTANRKVDGTNNENSKELNEPIKNEFKHQTSVQFSNYYQSDFASVITFDHF